MKRRAATTQFAIEIGGIVAVAFVTILLTLFTLSVLNAMPRWYYEDADAYEESIIPRPIFGLLSFSVPLLLTYRVICAATKATPRRLGLHVVSALVIHVLFVNLDGVVLVKDLQMGR